MLLQQSHWEVRGSIGGGNQLGACLTGGIRVVSAQIVGFAIGPDPFFVVVTFVRGYANYSPYRGGVADSFQQMRRAHDIGSVRPQRVRVRTSNQGLCRKVKDHVRCELSDGGLKSGEIQNIGPYVLDHCPDGRRREYTRLSVGVEGISAYLCAERAKPNCKPTALKTGMTGQKDTTALPWIYHIFQGASPLDQSSSSRCLSRKVSIACQKPRWK